MDPITEPHPSSSNSNYAFITHSQETLPRNLPPSIDNANLARRRRRRTSVHDQAILEEEYRICDRPDKTKRKEISSRVQMGEKEVQIWFQNKRQSARRKAKPLLPHEIIPNTTTNNSNNNSSQQYSSQQEYSQQGMMMPSSSQYSSFDNSQQSLSREDIRHMSTDADPDDEDFDDDDDIGEEEAEEEELRLRERSAVESPHHHLPQRRYEPSYYSKRQKLSSRDNHLLALLQQSSPPTSSIPSQESQHQQNLSLSSRHDQPEPEMTTSAHQRLQDVLSSMQDIISSSTLAKPTFTNSRRTNPNPNPTTPHAPPRLLKRTSSIRLSTSLEGKATIVLDEEPESPPSSQQTLPTPKKPSPIASSGPPRKIVDSKIWEFYCDNQAMIRSPATHASLQTAAEAKEALGLLRRKSSHLKLPPPLPPSSPVTHRKHGGKLAQPSSPTKAKKSRKILSAKLSRSKAVPAAKTSGSGKKLVDGLPSELGQESDKENRPPGAPVSPPPEPRRRGGKGEAKKAPAEKPSKKRKRNAIAADERRILEDHKTIPSQTSAVYDVPSSSQAIDNFRSDGPVADEYGMMLSQRSFSNYFASSQESGPAVMDEMECVENLLSLRGGTWR
ncbi:uncharacterized protein H6S33_011620 [Morchella sextelata]|uniref:uncharacterized protein n=1 Tax=Morchella sextelata TaxID=1174677 RepID=UPI001D055738|nr:uncharacterized protein H6S33_011620 [Morchella sextelata]KAH0611193.1 hypothetical protein H6S33_011620 [Morchella sextelata]